MREIWLWVKTPPPEPQHTTSWGLAKTIFFKSGIYFSFDDYKSWFQPMTLKTSRHVALDNMKVFTKGFGMLL